MKLPQAAVAKGGDRAGIAASEENRYENAIAETL